MTNFKENIKSFFKKALKTIYNRIDEMQLLTILISVGALFVQVWFVDWHSFTMIWQVPLQVFLSCACVLVFLAILEIYFDKKQMNNVFKRQK